MSKDLKDILEDAQDGRLKKSNQKKAKAIVDQLDKAVPASGYEWKGQIYARLRDIPIPLTQAQAALAAGKIKEV